MASGQPQILSAPPPPPTTPTTPTTTTTTTKENVNTLKLEQSFFFDFVSLVENKLTENVSLQIVKL